MITEKDKGLYEAMIYDKSTKEYRDEEVEELQSVYTKKQDTIMLVGVLIAIVVSLLTFIYTVNVEMNLKGFLEVEGLKGYIIGLAVIVLSHIGVIVLFNCIEDDPFGDSPPMRAILIVLAQLLLIFGVVAIAVNYVPFIEVEGTSTVLRVMLSLWIPFCLIVGVSVGVANRVFKEYLGKLREVDKKYE